MKLYTAIVFSWNFTLLQFSYEIVHSYSVLMELYIPTVFSWNFTLSIECEDTIIAAGLTFEPQHEKAFLMTCVPNKDSHLVCVSLDIQNVPGEDSDQITWIKALIITSTLNNMNESFDDKISLLTTWIKVMMITSALNNMNKNFDDNNKSFDDIISLLTKWIKTLMINFTLNNIVKSFDDKISLLTTWIKA